MKIRLVDPGRRKIATIKVVRQFTGLSLVEAKRLVDRAPFEFHVRVGESLECLEALNELADQARLTFEISGMDGEVGALIGLLHKIEEALLADDDEKALGLINKAGTALRKRIERAGDKARSQEETGE